MNTVPTILEMCFLALNLGFEILKSNFEKSAQFDLFLDKMKI